MSVLGPRHIKDTGTNGSNETSLSLCFFSMRPRCGRYRHESCGRMVHNGMKLAQPPEAIALIDGSRRRIHRALGNRLNSAFLHATSIEPRQLCIQSRQVASKLWSCRCHAS